MTQQILDGVKVVDFTWVVVGPSTTQYLAEHGATVIRVESKMRLDQLRTQGPFKDGKPGVNRSGYFAHLNSNKYSTLLNMRHSKAREIVVRLIRWADIVAENFSPGTMDKWGLGYHDLVKIKPNIIMFSCSIHGQTGPHANMHGYGGELASALGFTFLTGWPDRDPSGLFGAHTDFAAPRMFSALLVAALSYRRRTGKGLHLDASQLECGLQYLSPVLLDAKVNGRQWQRQGNRSAYACPHGAYRCRGKDRWCAISVFTYEEWFALCGVIGRPQWVTDEKFRTLLDRKHNEEELDRLVEEWTQNFTAEEVMEHLQTAGVPAGIVETPEDIRHDSQLADRKHFEVLEHTEIGVFPFEKLAFILSKTPGKINRPSPCLGEHSRWVCTQLLDISEEEYGQLVADNVIC